MAQILAKIALPSEKSLPTWWRLVGGWELVAQAWSVPLNAQSCVLHHAGAVLALSEACLYDLSPPAWSNGHKRFDGRSVDSRAETCRSVWDASEVAPYTCLAFRVAEVTLECQEAFRQVHDIPPTAWMGSIVPWMPNGSW